MTNFNTESVEQIPSSRLPLDSDINPAVLKTGGVSGFRHRGGRLSRTVVALLEFSLSDLLSFRQRIQGIQLFTAMTGLTLTGTVSSGIYGLETENRTAPDIQGLQDLSPALYQISEIRLQTLRLKLQHRLSS